MSDIILKEESYAIVGACMEVHNTLGSGFQESVYQESLEKEFNARGIHYVRQKRLKLYYNNEELRKYYVADFVCFDKIILEIKASTYIITEHEKQLINYLKATKMNLGLLINFGEPSLIFRRYVY